MYVQPVNYKEASSAIKTSVSVDTSNAGLAQVWKLTTQLIPRQQIFSDISRTYGHLPDISLSSLDNPFTFRGF